MLRAALEQNRTVLFTYSSSKGALKQRIEPYCLIFHWFTWYIWAWCENQEKFHLFPLDRMTNLSIDEVFLPRQVFFSDLNLEQIFPMPYKVKALFIPKYEQRLVEEYGANSFTVQSDGKLLFIGEFPSEVDILSWILTFENGVELLEPVELRQKLRLMGKWLGEIYKEE